MTSVVREIVDALGPIDAPGSFDADAFRTAPYTDTGNAERLELLAGPDLRWCAAAGKWYAWSGARWEADDLGRVELAAKDVARRLYIEAGKSQDDARRREMAGWARQSESAGRRAAMISLARCEGRIPIRPDAFDANPMLLNTSNGVVDLRTGELLPHERERMMTRLAPVAYDPGARSELWARFLHEATGGDADLGDFLQRAAGYSLSGDTREEKLFMVLGPGGTGKSTFLESVRGILGDYSTVSDFETFTFKRDAGVRNDIAALAGRRMVVSIEVEQGRHLAEGLVKALTGRDTITARFLFREHFEFRPQFKLWLAANDPPNVRGADSAIWRRILRIPFDAVVPADRRDPTLKARLLVEPEHQRAILAWAVEGCLRWQEDGLGEPACIRRATDEYRESQNPLRPFIEDCCELGNEFSVGTGTLRRAYERYAEREGYQNPLGPMKFTEGLRALGITSERSNSERLWRGVRLRDGF